MKKLLYVGLGVLAGVSVTVGATVYAQNMEVKTNTIPVKVNGQPVELKGYNIGGHTYFQLRDIGDATGFKTEFKNNTIFIRTNN